MAGLLARLGFYFSAQYYESFFDDAAAPALFGSICFIIFIFCLRRLGLDFSFISFYFVATSKLNLDAGFDFCSGVWG